MVVPFTATSVTTPVSKTLRLVISRVYVDGVSWRQPWLGSVYSRQGRRPRRRTGARVRGPDRGLVSAMSLALGTDGRVERVFVIVSPAKLGHLHDLEGEPNWSL